MSFEEAVEAMGQILMCPGPLDPEPHEFAAGWVVDSGRTELLWLRDQCREADAFRWQCLQEFVDEWAGRDPEAVLEAWTPLLGEEVGRERGLFALSAVARYHPRLLTDVERTLAASTESE